MKTPNGDPLHMFIVATKDERTGATSAMHIVSWSSDAAIFAAGKRIPENSDEYFAGIIDTGEIKD